MIGPDIPRRAYAHSLAELCFWLFLVNSGAVQQDWFRSLYFKTWIGGSLIAITYMPLVTIFTRADPVKVMTTDPSGSLIIDADVPDPQCEAFTFLAGSLGSLSLTLWFLPILSVVIHSSIYFPRAPRH